MKRGLFPNNLPQVASPGLSNDDETQIQEKEKEEK